MEIEPIPGCVPKNDGSWNGGPGSPNYDWDAYFAWVDGKSNKEEELYDEGYDDGYDDGYDEGYDDADDEDDEEDWDDYE